MEEAGWYEAEARIVTVEAIAQETRMFFFSFPLHPAVLPDLVYCRQDKKHNLVGVHVGSHMRSHVVPVCTHVWVQSHSPGCNWVMLTWQSTSSHTGDKHWAVAVETALSCYHIQICICIRCDWVDVDKSCRVFPHMYSKPIVGAYDYEQRLDNPGLFSVWSS